MHESSTRVIVMQSLIQHGKCKNGITKINNKFIKLYLIHSLFNLNFILNYFIYNNKYLLLITSFIFYIKILECLPIIIGCLINQAQAKL